MMKDGAKLKLHSLSREERHRRLTSLAFYLVTPEQKLDSLQVMLQYFHRNCLYIKCSLGPRADITYI